jgi:serine/threonine protein kinase
MLTTKGEMTHNIVYNTQKEAISNLTGINKSKIKKVKTFGMENDGIYSYRDRIFKISSSRAEYFVAQRLFGEKFENVVNIYGYYECDILGKNGDSVWKSYIIEEEKLKRVGRNFAFNNFDLQTVCLDPIRRIPYFASVLNGIAELASVGIVYYDLHPLNVMYNDKGQVKIIDFGYAVLKRTKEDKRVKVSYKIESL